MKITKIHLLTVLIALVSISLQACKTKKLGGTAANPYGVAKEEPAEEKTITPEPVKETKEEPAPVDAKPDFNFHNIQFEFNSIVLKTNSYSILDKAAAEMKKDPGVKFIINGHSSSEGSTEHNLSLSRDRANSVKTYLVNAGVSGSNLQVKGFGESKPINTNDTEEARALNRRVEIEYIK